MPRASSGPVVRGPADRRYAARPTPLRDASAPPGARRFAFEDHMFRSRRSFANLFQIRTHELRLTPHAGDGIEATSSLLLSSWNFQTFPSPAYYPPRLTYTLWLADGAAVRLGLSNELGFACYRSAEIRTAREVRHDIAIDAIAAASWTVGRYGGNALSFRLKGCPW